jgi:hypothetical protein
MYDILVLRRLKDGQMTSLNGQLKTPRVDWFVLSAQPEGSFLSRRRRYERNSVVQGIRGAG